MAVVVDHDPNNAEALAAAIGPGTTILSGMEMLHGHLEANPFEDVVVLGATIESSAAFHFAELSRVSRPSLGVVLVRRRVETSLLTEALRSGVREVVADRDLKGLGDAVRRAREIARQIRRHVDGGTEESSRHRGTAVTVFSTKGGAGKTTLATNLAAALANGGLREVCLLDLDLAFGDVAISLQLYPNHTIADAVPLADSLDEPAIQALLTHHSAGLSALVAPFEPGASEAVSTALVSDLISLLKGMFDYVVIDTPAAFTDHVLASFDASEIIALVATLDILALKNLKLTLETLDLLNYPRETWRVVLNRADSKVGLALSDVQKTLKVPIASQIPSSRAVPAAVNRGVALVLEEPHHAVSSAIRQFAERLNVPGGTPVERRARRERVGFRRRKAATT